MTELEAAVRVLIPVGCALAGIGLVGRGLPPLMNSPAFVLALKDLLLRLQRVFMGLIVFGAVCLFLAASVHCVHVLLRSGS